MNSTGTDIIIPVYNAYEDLVRCIASVIKWTDLSRHRLILINDCSKDQRIAPYLEQLESAQIMVIYNTHNQGFSASVNLGIMQSEHRDVILLNSDTVVTKDWAEKLKTCAYSDPGIATATPLSNNATICSVPYFLEDNSLPKGYTIDEYAHLIEKVSMRKYPKIPTANGFCMFIKRNIIKLVGKFDTQAFQRGYGEENDFCCRAVEAGYYHAMCDDTFILHRGTASFSDADKRKYAIGHEKVLKKRYPALMQELRIYCRENPAGIISKNIRMRTKMEETCSRNAVLYLLDINAKYSVAQVKKAIQILRCKYRIVIATRDADCLRITVYLHTEELVFRFAIGSGSDFEVFRSMRFAKLYGRILDVFQIDCVHIHSVMGLTHELYYEAAARKIPIYTILYQEDYKCPKQPCQRKDMYSCADCLNQNFGITKNMDYLRIWRTHYLKILKLSEKIFVIGQKAKERLCEYAPYLAERCLAAGNELALEEFYAETLHEHRSYDCTLEDNEWLLNGYQKQEESWEFYIQMQNKLARQEQLLDEIEHSISYQFAKWIASMPIPFRSRIRKMIVRWTLKE